MAIQIQGNAGTVAEVDGTSFRSLRTRATPIDHLTLGHYRVSRLVPLIAAQAINVPVFAFRWGDATRLAVLLKLRLSILQTLAATATIYPVFQAFIGRAWTNNYTTGATAVGITGNSAKKRTSMGTTLVSQIAYSNGVAGGMSAGGNPTLDPEPFLECPTSQTITTPNTTMYEKELEIDMGHGIHPYVFAQNEGFVVRPNVAFGAAGTANLIVDCSWAEVAAF